MAKLNEQKITFKISELLKDSDDPEPIVSEENAIILVQALESILEGKNVIIEVEYQQ